MSEPAQSSKVRRFGMFEVDLQAGELRKAGLRIKLQEQPFQILTLLLERPGQVVTREELCQRLWPTNTFIDFDHSLNSAVKKLRRVLGDDPDNPRFIETLPRRGYRFLALVETGRDHSALEKEATEIDRCGRFRNPRRARAQRRALDLACSRRTRHPGRCFDVASFAAPTTKSHGINPDHS
jgi:DNA-binding winged helix-turn-helix (wHTH) protein